MLMADCVLLGHVVMPSLCFGVIINLLAEFVFVNNDVLTACNQWCCLGLYVHVILLETVGAINSNTLMGKESGEEDKISHFRAVKAAELFTG
jgi:hypothetical protein